MTAVARTAFGGGGPRARLALDEASRRGNLRIVQHAGEFPDASASEGIVCYDSATDSYWFSDGAVWRPLGVGAISSGSATLDFGATGAQEATVAVTGQTAIAADSDIWCWLGGSTADNDEYSHTYATQAITIGVASITPGVGFTIRGVNRDQSATRTWNVLWGWV